MNALSRRVVARAAAAALLVALLQAPVEADVTCGHCGCIMHTNQAPPTCWGCGQPLYSPGPIPGNDNGVGPFDDLGPLSSGFELGVTFVSTPRGIRVTRVKPGSAASGVLFVNDIIAAAAYRDDNGRKRQMPTRTSSEMETVKHLAGQSKTALLIRRPSGQVRYAFVTFRPIGGQGVPVAAGVTDEEFQRTYTSGITIDETGEAAELFDAQGDSTFVPQGGESGGDASDFFNNR